MEDPIEIQSKIITMLCCSWGRGVWCMQQVMKNCDVVAFSCTFFSPFSSERVIISMTNPTQEGKGQTICSPPNVGLCHTVSKNNSSNNGSSRPKQSDPIVIRNIITTISIID